VKHIGREEKVYTAFATLHSFLEEHDICSHLIGYISNQCKVKFMVLENLCLQLASRTITDLPVCSHLAKILIIEVSNFM